MRKMYFGILILVVFIVGACIFLNTSSFTNEYKISDKTFTIPQGFKVIDSTNNSVNMENKDMMRLKLIKSDDEDLNYAVLNYKNVYDDYNISIINGTLENIEIKKTVATKVGNGSTNLTITKYWFDKNGTIYNIQSINGSEIIDKNAKEIIDSIR